MTGPSPKPPVARVRAWVRALPGRVWHALIVREASTRLLGVLRIGLTLVFITRFSHELTWWRFHGVWWTVATISFVGSSTLMLLGWLWPLTRVWNLFTVGWMAFGVAGLARHEGWAHHHTRLLFAAMALLSLAPAASSFSLDRLRAVRRAPGEAPPERGPVWATKLMALQASAVYFWGAWDKLEWPYLNGTRLQHHITTYVTHFDTPDAGWFGALCAVLAVGSVALEFVLAFGLWFRRWWWLLAAVGALFHLLLYFSLPVSTFSATILVLYLAYVDPDVFHAALDRHLGAPVTRGSAALNKASPSAGAASSSTTPASTAPASTLPDGTSTSSTPATSDLAALPSVPADLD